jgi:hypothetical protein
MGTKTNVGRKTTDAQVMQRVDEVLRIRLDGAQVHDIREYAREKGWDVCDRQLRRYIDRADRLLTRQLEKDRDKLFARHVAQRRALYARALNAADYSVALRVLDSEAELLGLFPEKNTKKNGENNGPPIQINVFQRAEDLAQQLRNRAVDAGVPRSLIPVEHRGEPMDTAPAHPEAERIPVSG